ncbi:MAG: hypothetical protein WCS94_25590, partial [Verrucomicrobiota bacterium]
EFIAAFHEAHGYFQDSQDLLEKGDVAGARTLIAKCHPEQVIQQFARFSSLGGITRGELGLIVSLNTRWLSHIIRQRQALGLEPVRINFAPTSQDLLAQARGTFTFYFGPNRDLWECWGEEETGAAVISLPPLSPPATNTSALAGWSEVGRTGIELAQPLKLSLRPILASSNLDKAKSLSLLAGDYRLRMLFRHSDSTAPGQRILEVKVSDLPADRVDLVSQESDVNHLVELIYPVTLKSASAAAVTLTPVKGQAVLCGAVLEPAR